MFRRHVALVSLATALFSPACASGASVHKGSHCAKVPFAAPHAAPTSGAPSAALVLLAVLPGAVAAATDPATGELFVIDRPGRVWRVHGSGGAPVLSADLRAAVGSTGTEQGLLDIAFDAAGDQLYLSFTATDGAVHVEAAPPGDLSRRTVLLNLPKRVAFHNGGELVVEPNGNLLVGIGDDNAPDTPIDSRPQDPGSPYGKILELDPTRPGSAARVVALGLRNPWRFTRAADGSLWIGDVGERCAEEVDHVSPGAPPPNLGWPLREGTLTHAEGLLPPGAVSPVFEYGHGPRCAVIQGPVYTGRALPELSGRVLFGDYCTGEIFALDPATAEVVRLAVDVAGLTSFAQTADGEVLVVSEQRGVFRLGPAR